MRKRSAKQSVTAASSASVGERIITGLKSLFLPGGLVLLVALLANGTGVLSSPMAARLVDYAPVIILGAGLLLSAVFRRSRLFFAFLVLTLAGVAVTRTVPALELNEARHIILDAVTLLAVLDLLALAFLSERGIISASGQRRLALLGAQAVLVAILCLPDVSHALAHTGQNLFAVELLAGSKISQPVLLVLLLAAGVLAVKLARQYQAVESSLLWGMVAGFLALEASPGTSAPAVYFLAAGLVLMVAVIETSYAMAYRDELTQLPSRRALNEALLQLGNAYSIAMVDVDHFKKFNDTYGHEAGDHVLRLVAARLAKVEGGGKAYRYGGEEFAVLFPRKSAEESSESMDLLRRAIEQTSFVIRGNERRNIANRGKRRGGGKQTSVTVSIGLAESRGDSMGPEEVLKLADKALYRAKERGRNCTVATRRPRVAVGTGVLDAAR
ncbi:MAG TPA: GGDEF domain-containing protein [Candidatus Angelobacter sp.]|nr:GGDEF domain-containing protein [Candidatus Angelobacter sp.]